MAISTNQAFAYDLVDYTENSVGTHFWGTCTTSGSSYNNTTQYCDCYIDGIYHSTSYTLPQNSTVTVFDLWQTVYRNNISGAVIGASYSYPTTPSGGTKYWEGSLTVPNIWQVFIVSPRCDNTDATSATMYYKPAANLDAAQFRIRKKGSGWGAWTNITNIVSGDWNDSVNGCSYKILGLEVNSTYEYQLKFTYEQWHWYISPIVEFTTKGVARIKINGIWKQAIPWVKVNGVWKQAIPFVKVNGTWKIGT